MKRRLLHVAGIIVLTIGSIASSFVFAQTTANGPYYATPSWDQQLPSSTRFIVLSNWSSQAVLDRETGLVWERSPSLDNVNWFAAIGRCIQASTGGRHGWRLPTIHELGSLTDAGGLPAGHPFLNVDVAQLGNAYWSSTPEPSDPTVALIQGFPTGSFSFGSNFKDQLEHTWCVRGGQGVDGRP